MDTPDQELLLAMQASLSSRRAEEQRRKVRDKEATELAIALSQSQAGQGGSQLAIPSAGIASQATRLEDSFAGEDKMDDLEAAIIASISDVEGQACGSGTKSSGARLAIPPEGHSLRGDSCSNTSDAAAKSQLQEWMTVCQVSAGARFRDDLFPPTEQSLGDLSESSLQVQVHHSDGRRSVRRIRPTWASPLDLFPTRQDKSNATTSDEIRQIAIAHAGRSGKRDTHAGVIELQDRMGRGMPLDDKDVELVRVLGASMFQLTRPSGEPSAMDVRQAGLGTCWFVSAMAVACEHEGNIRRLFRQKTLPSHGMLQLQLCVGGEWRVVTTDDCLPTDRDNGTLLFTSGRMQQLWPSYLEKGIAKLSGSFAEAAGGGVGEGLKYLTGAPIEHINTKTCLTDGEEKLRRLALHAASGEGGRSWLPRWLQDQCDERPATEGELWARLLSWSQAGFLVGASCGKVDRDETPDAELQPRYQARGLVFNHAYSILKVVEVPLPLLPERYRRTVSRSRDRSTMASDAASLRGASAPESGAGTGLGGSVVLRRHSSGELMEVERVVVLRNPWSDASEVGWNGRYGRTWGGVRDSPEVSNLLFGDLTEARDGLFSSSSIASGAGAASAHSSTIPPGVFGMAFDDFRQYFGSADAACARKGYSHARMTAMMPVSLAVDVPIYPAYVVTDHSKSMSATACVSQLCQRMRNGMQVRMAIAHTRGRTEGNGDSVAASAATAGSAVAPFGDDGAGAAKVAAEYGWEVSRCEDVSGMADVGCVVVRLAGKMSPQAAVKALNSKQWELADGQHSLPNSVGATSGTLSAASSVSAPVPPQLLRSCPRAMVESVNTDFYLDKDYTHVIVPLSLGPLTTESAQRLTTSLHGPHDMALTPVMLGGRELAQVLCARSRAIGKAMPLARLGPGCCVWTTGGDSGDVLVVENSNPNVWLQLQVDYSEGSSNVHFSRGSDVTMDYIQPRSRQVLQIASQADSRRGYRLSFKFSAKSVSPAAVAHSMASGTFTRNFPSIVAGSVHEHVSAG